MQPKLIAVTGDNKRAIYSYEVNGSKGVFEADLKTFAGKLYYTHQGRNFPLPAEFQGKKPVFKH